MSLFTKCPPLIAIPPDYKLYKVQINFEYHVGDENSLEIIKVPKGFITDGASIPKFAWSILGGPMGEYSAAAVVHDYCYKYKLYTRKRCDYIFYEAMQVLEVPFWKRWLMYHAVRTFAWLGWNAHRRRERKKLEEA